MTSSGNPALDELLSSRAPLPFEHCPERLPAEAPNGSCNPLSTIDAAVIRGNIDKFEAAKACIEAGDTGVLAELYKQFSGRWRCWTSLRR